MRHPFTLTTPIGTRATLGLIVLQADETLEQDARRLLPLDGVALYTSRVPSGDAVSTESLAAMEEHLPAAARLLPRAARFDAVGYGCTSGAMTIGAARVAEQVRRGVATRHVTDPLTGARAALVRLGVRRLAIVSPYVGSVAEPLADAFRRAGHEVVSTLTFGEETEERVARIDPASIRAAALAADRPEAQAIFLSCTNLRTLDVIPDIEAATGKPCLSSNLCLLQHMAALSGIALNARRPPAP